jgi:SAM-dependent methyltransferase
VSVTYRASPRRQTYRLSPATLSAELEARAEDMVDWTGQAARDAAAELAAELASAQRELLRADTAIPSSSLTIEITTAFQRFLTIADGFDRASRMSGIDVTTVASDCRDLLTPWLSRSPGFHRARYQPHGYPGDYQLLEDMYALETEAAVRPTRSGMINLLNQVMVGLPSVRALWERRHRFAGLLADAHSRRGQLRVLDIGCGGGRHLRDFLAGVDHPESVELALIDHDPAALAYCETASLAPWRDRLALLHMPISTVWVGLQGEYDVVLSSCLFDFLPDSAARALLAAMSRCLAPDGILAISNFHPDVLDRVLATWFLEWPITFRDDDAVRSVFPAEPVTISSSADKSLLFACNRSDPFRTHQNTEARFMGPETNP